MSDPTLYLVTLKQPVAVKVQTQTRMATAFEAAVVNDLSDEWTVYQLTKLICDGGYSVSGGQLPIITIRKGQHHRYSDALMEENDEDAHRQSG